MRYVLTVLALAVTTLTVAPYKILVYSPTMSRSHMQANGRIADALAQDGHNVTLFELDTFVEPGDIKTAHYAKHWPYTFNWTERQRENEEPLFSSSPYEEYIAWKTYIEWMHRFCIDFLSLPIIDELRAENFDAIIYEQFEWCPVALAEILDIKVKIWLSSCPLVEHQGLRMGVPMELSYVPAMSSNFNSDRMGFFNRIENILRAYAAIRAFEELWSVAHHDVEKLLGHPFPNLWELASTADLSLVNTDEIVDFPRPLPPNVIHIGGIGMEKANRKSKPLPAEISELLNNGKKGVVLFSMGSIVPTYQLLHPFFKNILDTFAKLSDYQFIVKVSDKDVANRELAKSIPNVYVSDWLPQSAILEHPRLALFITHGGYNSIMEAAHNGVPVLAVGIFGDQPRNSKLVQRNGWGLAIDKMKLLEGAEEFERDIRRLLTEPKFKAGAQRVQHLLETKPMSGRERLTSYVRFLEENGGHLPELKTLAPELSFVVYNNLDILAFALLLITTSTVFLGWSVYRVVIFIRRITSVTETKQKVN